MRAFAVLLVLAAVPARAELSATFTGSIEAVRVRKEPPIERRGLVTACIQSLDCFDWIWTGLDPDDTEEVGISAHATALPDRRMLLGGRVWLRAAGWRLELRPEYQPAGDLASRLARSGRDVLEVDGTLGMPAFWSAGTREHQLLLAALELDVATVTVHHVTGMDVMTEAVFARWQTRRYALDIVRPRAGMLYAIGTGVFTYDVDLLRATWHVTPQIDAIVHAGIATATLEHGESDEPAYGLELRGGWWSAGAGSWLRYDPTGRSVDAGHLATASIAWHHGGLRTEARGELGRTRRDLVAPDAVVAPVGTRMWLSRGEASAAYRLVHNLELRGGVWIERSDRDDPRWDTPASGTLATHAGVDLGAAVRFGS